MDRFPSDAHLSSWAGTAPGNSESAGKRKSRRTKKGNKALRSALVETAHEVVAKGKPRIVFTDEKEFDWSDFKKNLYFWKCMKF
jgi:transposase